MPLLPLGLDRKSNAVPPLPVRTVRGGRKGSPAQVVPLGCRELAGGLCEPGHPLV